VKKLKAACKEVRSHTELFPHSADEFRRFSSRVEDLELVPRAQSVSDLREHLSMDEFSWDISSAFQELCEAYPEIHPTTSSPTNTPLRSCETDMAGVDVVSVVLPPEWVQNRDHTPRLISVPRPDGQLTMRIATELPREKYVRENEQIADRIRQAERAGAAAGHVDPLLRNLAERSSPTKIFEASAKG
jgi:hypothetical protein